MDFDRIVAVRMAHGEVWLAGIRGDMLHYWLDELNTRRWHDSMQVEAEYTEHYRADTASNHKEIELLFLQDFGPKPVAPCASLGWIAPNGDFYPCAYESHEHTAIDICKLLYGRGYGAGHLEKHNWVKVDASGFSLYRRILAPQVPTLKAIYDCFYQYVNDIDGLVELLGKDFYPWMHRFDEFMKMYAQELDCLD